MTKILFNSSKIKLIALAIGIILFFLPAILFLCKFHSGLSNNIVAWNNTANYFNSIYSPILTFIAAIFVYKTYQNQRRANKISEFAFVSVYFKKELMEFNSGIDTKTYNFLNNKFFNSESLFENHHYNNEFIEFYKLIESSSNEFILGFRRIESELNNYQISPEPKYTFAKEMGFIRGNLEKYKRAIERIKNHLNGIDTMEESQLKSYLLESCYPFRLETHLEQINEIIKKYELR